MAVKTASTMPFHPAASDVSMRADWRSETQVPKFHIYEEYIIDGHHHQVCSLQMGLSLPLADLFFGSQI